MKIRRIIGAFILLALLSMLVFDLCNTLGLFKGLLIISLSVGLSLLIAFAVFLLIGE